MDSREPPTGDDELLDRYLAGELPDSETERLLVRLVRSPALRAQLDELRRSETLAGDLSLADDSRAEAEPSAGLPLAPALLTVTPPPYRLGRLLGARKEMMGLGDQGRIFDRHSRVELEVEPTDDLGEHQPVRLLLADADGRLHAPAVTAEMDDDVWVFTSPADALFPTAGAWTLCVLIGVGDMRGLVTYSLDTVRALLPPARMLTLDVAYQPSRADL